MKRYPAIEVMVNLRNTVYIFNIKDCVIHAASIMSHNKLLFPL